jgi:hypothetical protein
MGEIQLSDRDYQILWYTWQNRFLCFRHYQRKFWPGARNSSAVRQRIYKLRDAGYLNQAILPMLDARSIFCATNLGNTKLADIGLIKPDEIDDFPRKPAELTPTLRHDLDVVDLRISFEATGADVRSWITDHQLRLARPRASCNTRTPDGIFEVFQNGQSHPAALEYELASYSQQILMRVLLRMKSRYRDHLIFFVCRSAERAHSFRKMVIKAHIQNDRLGNMFFGHIEAALVHGLKSGFLDLSGKVL